MTPTIWEPSLLNMDGYSKPLKVFLCGPGYRSDAFDFRESLKARLEECPNVKVVYGEELEKLNFRRRGADLQTLEADFAHSVDFTVLILDSPGSIAELGTFSMINNIRSRLFVVLSSQFHEDESYIARGPLSLISATHNNNIIYYDKKRINEVYENIMKPIMLYKYLRCEHGHWYTFNALSGHRKKEAAPNYYEDLVAPLRRTFFESMVLVAVLVLGTPTFAELVNLLRLAPSEISLANKGLFEKNKLEKFGAGKYRALNGYGDELLTPYNTSKISQMRAKIIGQS